MQDRPLRAQQAIIRRHKLDTPVPVARNVYTPCRATALGAEAQAGRAWGRQCIRIQRAQTSYGYCAEPKVLYARHWDFQVSTSYLYM